MLPTSSVTSASTRLGVCSRFQLWRISVNASYNILGAGGAPTALSEISGHPEDKWGGAVMAALQIKNIPTGPGDDFKVDVSYAKGVTKQVISTSGGSPSFAMFGGTGRPGAYQSIGFGQTADAVYLPGFFGGTGDIKLVDSWGIRGAFNHNWDPYWSSSLFGSYASVRYDGSVQPTSSPPRVSGARASTSARPCLQTIAATRTSTLPRLVLSPAGLPSRT